MRRQITADGGEDVLTIILRALTDRRRRYLLYYLHEQPDPVHVKVVVRQIRAWEADRTVDDNPDEECERVLVDLYHNHLSRLADEGLVEYDQWTRIIRLRRHSELLTTLLYVVKQIEKRIDM